MASNRKLDPEKAWEWGYSQTCDQNYGCHHFNSYIEFFLAVEDTLDAIEFEGASKKEMVKPGLYVELYELLSYLREMYSQTWPVR